MNSLPSKAEAKRIAAKLYYEQNAVAIRAKRKQWRADNRDRVAAWNATQTSKPGARAAAAERTSDWREANPGRHVATNRAWREANPEAFKRSRDKWFADNPGASRAIGMNRRARIRGVDSVPFTLGQIEARIAYFGYRCWMCRGPYEQLDHVKPLAKGGPHMLSNLRPSCAQCNVRKNGLWFGIAGLNRFIR